MNHRENPRCIGHYFVCLSLVAMGCVNPAKTATVESTSISSLNNTTVLTASPVLLTGSNKGTVCTSGVIIWNPSNDGYSPNTTVKDPSNWNCYWNGTSGNSFNRGEPISGNGWKKNPSCPVNDDCTGVPQPKPTISLPAPVPSPNLTSPYFKSNTSGIIHPAGMIGPKQLAHLKSLNQQSSNFIAFKKRTSTDLTQSPYYSAPLSFLSSYTNKQTSTALQLADTGPSFYGFVLYSGAQAYQQTIMYEITGDAIYANNAISIFNQWSSNLRSYGPNPQMDCPNNTTDEYNCQNSPLVWGWAMASWFKAAELLKYTYPGWNSDTEQQMLKWFDSLDVIPMWKSIVLRPDSYHSQYTLNNWDTTICEALLYYSYLKDDKSGVDYVEAYYKRMVDGIKNNSGQSDAIYIAATGEEVETCRDLEHANYGIGGLVQLAEAFWQQGVDLYSYGAKGNSGLPGLAQVLETTSYIQRNQTWPKGVSSNSTLWRTNGFQHGSGCVLQKFDYKPGGYEIGYNHFANRLNLNLPNTKLVNDANADTLYYFHFGLGVLTHANTN